jgi:hypothetical protein
MGRITVVRMGRFLRKESPGWFVRLVAYQQSPSGFSWFRFFWLQPGLKIVQPGTAKQHFLNTNPYTALTLNPGHGFVNE